MRSFTGPDLPIPIQIGFPELPTPMTEPSFQLVNLWLEDCDVNHAGCYDAQVNNRPTRLIDVGSVEIPHIRLVHDQGDVKVYTAL